MPRVKLCNDCMHIQVPVDGKHIVQPTLYPCISTLYKYIWMWAETKPNIYDIDVLIERIAPRQFMVLPMTRCRLVNHGW